MAMKLVKRMIRRGLNALGYDIRRVHRSAPRPKIFGTRRETEYKVPVFDLVVTNAVLQDNAFFFLQVGANDGVTNDPVHHLVVRFDLPGILVEPLSGPFERLKRNYCKCKNLRFENAAISEQCGLRDLYLLKPEYERPNKYGKRIIADRLASFDPGHATRFLAKMHGLDLDGIDPEEVLIREKVRCITFDYLFDKYDTEKVDMLVLDMEGYDFEALKLFDFVRYQPKIAFYEHSGLAEDEREECWAYVADRGYQLYPFHSNTLAIRNASD